MTLVDKFTDLAVQFGEQNKLTMVNFVTDKNVEVTVEKATKLKLLLNSMCKELTMQLEWKFQELGITDLDHIGFDSYGNIVYTTESEDEDHKTLDIDLDIWVSDK